jgi:prepilin-type N-terminal cleavage/methylation domain-containing protein
MRNSPEQANARGFTLIELLIVVAIIAILALIAVPNFLEAQVRAKVSRTEADMRSTAVAMEAYCVDHNGYPPYGNPLDFDFGGEPHHFLPVRLTTPVAYVTVLYEDVFPVLHRHAGVTIKRFHPFHYLNDQDEDIPVAAAKYRVAFGQERTPIWMIRSHGPDVDCDEGEVVYDPTNGTISNGDIMRFGP